MAPIDKPEIERMDLSEEDLRSVVGGAFLSTATASLDTSFKVLISRDLIYEALRPAEFLKF